MEEKVTFTNVLKCLGESSSLHGIPRILASRQTAVKVLWGLLLSGAIVLFCLQFVELLQEYQSFPVKTTVSLKFASVPFPAVTICNINPFKSNSLGMSNESIHLNDVLYKYGNPVNVTAEDVNNQTNDDFYDQYVDDNLYTDIDDNMYEKAVSKSKYDSWKLSVLATLRDMPTSERTKLGHQVNDFIRSSKFAGFKFNTSRKFRKFSDSHYGNCFTVDDLPDAYSSGEDNGLTLQLNLEINEYFQHFSSAYGAKVVIHESGTYPLPHNEGIILNPGFETNVGVRLVRVRRLGGLYGQCSDDNGYDVAGTYYKNTVPLCHVLCKRDIVIKQCNCSPVDAPIDSTHVRTCSVSKTDTSCTYDAIRSLNADPSAFCNCPTTCTEDSYVTSVTGRAWPVQEYLEKVLLKELCTTNSTSFHEECLMLKLNTFYSYEDYQKISKNFLKVNIYFEDLNFEEISEEPLYNMIRFLSDVGGMMGLFLGASLLTFVEVLQLFLEMMLFFRHTGTSPISRIKIQSAN